MKVVSQFSFPEQTECLCVSSNRDPILKLYYFNCMFHLRLNFTSSINDVTG